MSARRQALLGMMLAFAFSPVQAVTEAERLLKQDIDRREQERREQRWEEAHTPGAAPAVAPAPAPASRSAASSCIPPACCPRRACAPSSRPMKAAA